MRIFIFFSSLQNDIDRIAVDLQLCAEWLTDSLQILKDHFRRNRRGESTQTPRGLHSQFDGQELDLCQLPVLDCPLRNDR